MPPDSKVSSTRGAMSSPARETSVSPKSPKSGHPKSLYQAGLNITRPDTAYSVPPATIVRNPLVPEGQLMYQLGKLAPLTPTYSASWVRNPPQRASVSDLRLAPSQRSQTCYSPEFLAVFGSVPPPPSARAYSAPRSTRGVPPMRSPRAAGGRPNTSPSQDGHGQGTPRSPVAAHSYGPGPPGSPSAASGFGTLRPMSPSAVSTNEADLPLCGLTEYLRSTTRSSLATGAPYHVYNPNKVPPAAFKSATKALTRSRSQSVKQQENTTLAARDAHNPLPTDAQLRMGATLSSDHGPKLPFKKRYAMWGI